ncbi:MAG: addiction module toxin, HicA family [Candidatus Abyssobacteria bacterium SURF_5]|uniref:Addiction module toxin, HicA family n=1 Tax=Abyssobacteria bacterium (strain SURF_5) TaxID=2093360 RepID=A0A3A4NAG2_ABYX5|nr:MAG: addiction module toxin, HicA family [Candidatus Abyssubacteria bacterium SURF_5]
MPKQPRLTPQEAETLLLKAGFQLIRSRGSHRIYMKDGKRIIIPFHAGKILHPKISKRIFDVIEQAAK